MYQARNGDKESRFSPRLATDERGCLFDERFREFVKGSPYIAESKSPAGIEALAALRMAARAMGLEMERWAERHGLSQGRLWILMRLRRAPGHQLPLGELAEVLDVSPRNVTGLVDHLERDGLVERVPDPGDRRSVMARLTPAGISRHNEIWREALEAQNRLVETFTPEELAQLRHLCLRVLQHMGAQEARA
jgi:DNA-binding MarR family transcriptional regulator